MKNILKGLSAVFAAMILVFSIQNQSNAGINEVGKSLKKDTVSSKATSEVQIKNKLAGSKPNTKAIKQPAKTKTKTPEIKTTINEVFKKSTTSKDLFFKKLFSKYLKNTPIVKIDKASQSFKTLETNFNSKKLNKPKVTAPLRIGRRAPVEGITPIADFPNFEADPNDTLEIEGVQDVNDIYNNSDYFFSGTFYDALIKINTFESMLPSFCEKYSKYPHICAMLKFYCAEIRALIFSAPQYGVYYDGYKFQELYTQIDETYSKETGPKEAMFKKLSEICKERINYISSDINTGIGQKISEDKATLSFLLDVIKKIKENKGVVEVVYNANGEGINFYRIGDLKLSAFGTGIYDSILLTYSQIIKDYCAMRNFNEASKVLEELNAFYLNEYPAKVQYNLFSVDENGNENQFGTENYTIKRDTATYTDTLKKYMEWNSQYGEIAENGEVFQNKVAEMIDVVNNYQLDTKKDNISLEELNNIKSRFPNKSDEGNDGYYSNKPTITDLYFTKTENIKVSQDEILDPFSTLGLRAQVESNKSSPLYSVYDVKINADDPSRERIIYLKRDFICGGYYAMFQANSRESEDVKDNLIDVNEGQRHPIPVEDAGTAVTAPSNKKIQRISRATYNDISVFQGLSELSEWLIFLKIKVPPSLYDKCAHFQIQRVRSHTKTSFDPPKKTIRNSQWFLKSGGAEFLTATLSNGICVYNLTKHVTDWFIIQGTGDPMNAYVGEGINSTNNILPSELFYTKNQQKFSEYSGMGVLLLCAPYCLGHYESWKHAVPDGVILGYHDLIQFDLTTTDTVLDLMTDVLNHNANILPQQVCDAWVKANRDVFNYNMTEEKTDYSAMPWSYSYIYNNECYYGEVVNFGRHPRLVTKKRP